MNQRTRNAPPHAAGGPLPLSSQKGTTVSLDEACIWPHRVDVVPIGAELRARKAAEDARQAARVALRSKAREDALQAGDLYRYAGALYERAAKLWRDAGEPPFADHCDRMARRLSSSPFAVASLVATF